MLADKQVAFAMKVAWQRARSTWQVLASTDGNLGLASIQYCVLQNAIGALLDTSFAGDGAIAVVALHDGCNAFAALRCNRGVNSGTNLHSAVR